MSMCGGRSNWAKNLKKGPLHDFLLELYPRTYKQKMPDGTVVEKKAAWVLD